MRARRYPSTEKIVVLGLAAMNRERRERISLVDVMLWIAVWALFGAAF